jgi:hypothetical protein
VGFHAFETVKDLVKKYGYACVVVTAAQGGRRRPRRGRLSENKRTGRSQSEADQQRGCETHRISPVLNSAFLLWTFT